MALPLESYLSLADAGSDLMPISGQILDPCGGLVDMREAQIRTLHPRSFWDDPTRLFRAERYCHRLRFAQAETAQAEFCRANQEGVLSSVSSKRIWNETVTAFDEKNPGILLERFFQARLYEAHRFLTERTVERVRDALERLFAVRSEIPLPSFRDGAVLVLLSALVEDGPADLLSSAHISKVVRREAVKLLSWVKGEHPASKSELRAAHACAAAFALTGLEEHLVALTTAISRAGGEGG
jgi:tRNA nucleotidyltransferase/poly(A) polymerase